MSTFYVYTSLLTSILKNTFFLTPSVLVDISFCLFSRLYSLRIILSNVSISQDNEVKQILKGVLSTYRILKCIY